MRLYSFQDQQTLFEAYRWMAEKLAQKTDIFIETEQHGKIPPLPWWVWYKVDGKSLYTGYNVVI